MLNTGVHALSTSSGFDIAPGQATSIAVTGKETILLPQPYGQCSNKNEETIRLAWLLGSTPNFTYDNIIQEDGYSVDICYSTCLQRLVFTTCGCFDIQQVYAYSDAGDLCGRIRNHSLTFFEEELSHDCMLQTGTGYDDSSGLGSGDLDSDESHNQQFENILHCLLPYNQSMHDLLDDIKCLQGARKIFDRDKSSLCDCKPPCQETTYDLVPGQSIWPAEGSQTIEAYEKVIHDDDVKLYNYLYSKGKDEDVENIINYLQNYSNSADVMQNFARLTIYASSPSVMQVEQLPAYTLINLISDIGISLQYMLLSYLIAFANRESLLRIGQLTPLPPHHPDGLVNSPPPLGLLLSLPGLPRPPM